MQLLVVLLYIVFLTFQSGELHVPFLFLLTTITEVQSWVNAKILIFFTEAVKLLISKSFEATIEEMSWFALDYFEKHFNNGSMKKR